ncbi:hypothetical protein R5Q19_05770 [Oenococcus oeni]
MSNFENYQVSNNFQIKGYWATNIDSILNDEKNKLVSGLLSYENGKAILELFGSFPEIDFSKGINAPENFVVYGISFDGLILKSTSIIPRRSQTNSPGYMTQNFEFQSFSILKNCNSLPRLSNELSSMDKILRIGSSHLDDWTRYENQLMEQSSDSNARRDMITYELYVENSLSEYDVMGKNLKVSFVNSSTSSFKNTFSFSLNFESYIKFIMTDLNEEFTVEYSIKLAESISKLLTLLTNKRSHPTFINENYSKKPNFSCQKSFVYEREDYFKSKPKPDLNIPFSLKDLGLETVKQLLNVWFDQADKIHNLVNNYLLQFDYPTPISIGLVNCVSGIESFYSEEKFGTQNQQIQNIQSEGHRSAGSKLEATAKIYKLLDELPEELSGIIFASNQEKIDFSKLINDNRVYFVHGTKKSRVILESELILPYRKLNFLVYVFICQELGIPEPLIIDKMTALYHSLF